MPRAKTAASTQAIASSPVAAQLQRPAGDLSGAAVDDRVQVDPAVLGGPDLGHIHVPQRIRTGHPEEPRTSPTVAGACWLQQLVGAHDPLHPLAIDRTAQLAAGQRRDHPGPIGRVSLGDLHDHLVIGSTRAGPGRHRPTTTASMQRLAGNSRETRATRATTAGL
jgi:hypothetical protein